MMPTQTDLAKIHIAKKELGMSDADYRGLLGWKFGVESAKDLKPKQVTVLLNHFRAKGWQQKKPTTVKQGRKDTKKVNDNYRRIKPGPAARQQKYILAMWGALGYEMKKLDARCKKQFGIDRIEWVTEHDQLHVLITDLKKRCEDAGIPSK